MATSGIFNMTTEQQAELLAKLVEKEERTKARGKAYRDANADKMKAWSEKARVRNLLLAAKAKAAGITVTDDEIDDYLASK
jgi:FKBP-type peptidyl-prolyl cis-trans isomerase (trigger factor)